MRLSEALPGAFWLFLLLFFATAPQIFATEERHIDFNQDILPIFDARCIACHGENQQNGLLRLDSKRIVFEGSLSGPAIIPGKADESLLYQRIASKEDGVRMPPVGDPLGEEQITAIRAWIEQGAYWPDDTSEDAGINLHWSFIQPTPPPYPKVENTSWPKNPIDVFTLAKMEAEGLSPAPQAKRETLLRRVYLDLIGLPPTLEEQKQFFGDSRPDAYERLVDRLLSSPRYGEKWGRHWLDVARYADTNGYEKDRVRSIWPYRDWVIHALNRDLPFDRFVIEQMAGDMLPNTSLDQKIATGFHRNSMHNEEGGVDTEEFRYEAIVDRVNTTSSAFLGLTMACAQCHNHKYDPISHKEYFQFFAFFNDADEPEIDVPDPEVAREREEIQKRIARMESELESRFPIYADCTLCVTDCIQSTTALIQAEERENPERIKALRERNLESQFTAWQEEMEQRVNRWQIEKPTHLTAKQNADLTLLDDLSILSSGDHPNRDTYIVDLKPEDVSISALRIEFFKHPDLPGDGPGRGTVMEEGNFMLSEILIEEVSTDGSEVVRSFPIVQASASSAKENLPVSNAIDGNIETGWSIRLDDEPPYSAVFQLAEIFKIDPEHQLRITLVQNHIHTHTIGRFRLALTGDEEPHEAKYLPAELEEILTLSADNRSTEQQERLRHFYLTVAPELNEYNEKIRKLRRSMPQHPTTLVMRQRETPRKTHIRQRGEFLRVDEEVSYGVPKVLHPLPDDEPLNRLTLAKWLVSEENPLIGRVVMNRIWHAYFGRGLVTTLEDFGTRSEPPTHPELLDWLALEFRARGWSLKEMHRLIVTSAIYRQSSRVTEEKWKIDPENEYYARMPRLRVDAEIVRDILLRTGGLLSDKIGGPSVFPPQPPGITELSFGPLKWVESQGEDRNRRGLYTFWKRTTPYPAFTTFDAPTSETSCVRRIVSNTPLQALTLLNDTVTVEAAQAMARQILSQSPPAFTERIYTAFHLCFARNPSRLEMEQLHHFYQRQIERFERNQADPILIAAIDPESDEADRANELAAWTAISRALLNLDETITKE